MMIPMVKLPSFLASFKSKKEPANYYVALKISSQALSACSWQIENGKVNIHRIDSAVIPEDAPDELLPIVDRIISTVTVNLDPEPKEILFGIFPDWSVDGKIIEPHMSKLRTLCRELGFTPMGFVTIPEAIVNYLKEVENTPVTAVLIGIEVGQIFVTLVKAGKISGTQIVPITAGASVNQLTEQALKQFSDAEILPSRILIYDGRLDLEKFREQLLTYPWTQKLPFLHFPKVEIVSSEAVIKAVASAGGTEMGGVISTDAEITKEGEVLPKQEASLPEADNSQTIREELVSSDDQVANVEPADFGFYKEKDVAMEESIKQEAVPVVTETVDIKGAVEVNKENKIKELFRNVKFPKFVLPRLNFVPLLFLPVILVTVVLGGFYVYVNYVAKAKITIYVLPKTLEKDQEVTVVPNGNTGEEDAKVSGSTIEVDESGTKRGVTTGKKLVGTKAKGTVTIYSTTIGRKFASGTNIIGPNSLKFALDSDVTIATGSAASPSTTTGNVTASGIGDSFNLSAGSLFTIADYSSSSYQGKNEAVFSGGSSHQALVVAKQDQDRLMATLSAELTSKAYDDLQSKLTPGQNLLDKAITSSIVQKKFDRDIDTEADSLSLTLGMHYTGVIFDQNNLVSLIGRMSQENIPGGYEFDGSRSTATITKTSVDKAGNIILSVHFTANLLPVMEKDDLTKMVAGKKFITAKQALVSQNGITNVEFASIPGLVSRFGMLPKTAKNISIEIVTQ